MLCYFKVEFYNSEEEEEIETTFTDTGFISANSLDEAVKKVTDYYGEENVISIKIYGYDDVLFTEDIIDIIYDNSKED